MLIPEAGHHNVKVSPFTQNFEVSRRREQLDTLTFMAAARKILFGATYQLSNIHPYDYCYLSLGISLELIEKETYEYSVTITNFSNNSYLQVTLVTPTLEIYLN